MVSKHYNRAVRVHKYIYEALMRLAWEEFLLWEEDNQEASTTIEAFVDKVNSMVCDVNQQEFDDMLDSPLLAKLMTLLISWNTSATTMESYQLTGCLTLT